MNDVTKYVENVPWDSENRVPHLSLFLKRTSAISTSSPIRPGRT